MMTAIQSIARLLSPRGWMAFAVLAVVLALALWLYSAGRDDGRQADQVDDLKAEVRAGAGRETAAIERGIDTANTADKLKEWNHAAEAIPDSAPDARELQRRCRQLRDAGRELAACR